MCVFTADDASFDSNTGEFDGSNGPYKFVASGSSITITDKNGCAITGSFTTGSNTPVASTPGTNAPAKKSHGETLVPGLVLAVSALAYLF